MNHDRVESCGYEGVCRRMESLNLLGCRLRNSHCGRGCVLSLVLGETVVGAELPREREDCLPLVMLDSVQSYVDQISEGIELLESVARGRISDHSTVAQVEGAKDDIFAVVFYEGDYFTPHLQARQVSDVVVYRGVLQALLCVVKNLCQHRSVLERHFST